MAEAVAAGDIPGRTARLVARNSYISLAGQLAPLLVAFFAIPLLMRGLGVERFGVLTIAWMVIGYFTLFDLGLSRATTRYVAEALGAGAKERVPELVWTSFQLHLLLGTVAGLVLMSITPVLVGSLLKIPAALSDEARTVLYILAFSVPVILMSSVLRGVVEALQRFDLIHLVQAPAGALMFLLPLGGYYLGAGLIGIVLLLVAARVVTLVCYLHICRTLFPSLEQYPGFNRQLVRPFFSYGGWMTLSNIAGPLLLSVDRFMIGALISLAAVSYYTVPYEITFRFMVFPASMIMALFPVFSSLAATSRETVIILYLRSMKYLLLLMGPLVLVLIFFAGDILHIWLGAEFARKSTPVFRLLAAGMLCTPIQVTVSLLHGTGRPDLTAKFYLLELVLYLPLMWSLVTQLGIAGAALAWVLRVLLDMLLLIYAAVKLYAIDAADFSSNVGWRTMTAVAGLAVLFWLISLLPLQFPLQVGVITSITLLFIILVWRFIFDRSDRETLGFAPWPPLPGWSSRRNS